MSAGEYQALETAARESLLAPSIFNTQPWQWRIAGNALELRSDWSRQLEVADPHGHSLLVSCGAALHHARVSLAAAGWTVTIDRTSEDRDLLARVCAVRRAAPDRAAQLLRAAIDRRHTDRRPFSDEPVPRDILRSLAEAASGEGVELHRVGENQMPMLAVAVAQAAESELADAAYRVELMRWINRPEWSDDGVPPTTAVTKVPRRVAVRAFVLEPNQGLPVTPGGDRGAAYLILHGEGRAPGDWLRAGEALSAVLLTAVSRGLAVAPLTDVLEVAHPRDLIVGLLGGQGVPYVLVRCGYPTDPALLARAPRRSAADVITPMPVVMP